MRRLVASFLGHFRFAISYLVDPAKEELGLGTSLESHEEAETAESSNINHIKI